MALLVPLIPAIDLLLALVGSRLRLEPVHAVSYGLFAVLWFLAPESNLSRRRSCARHSRLTARRFRR